MKSGIHTLGLLPLGLLAAVLAGCPPQPVEECTQDADCPDGETCLEDGSCLPAETASCTLDADCGNGRVCAQGVCVTRNNRDGGGVGPADGGGSSSGQAGLGVLYLSPSDSVDFGSPLLGMAISKNIVVRNDGQGPLTISAVTRGGQTSTEYSITPPPLPRVLGPGEEDRIVISYTLADAEADIGSVIIASDARTCTFNCPDASTVRVELFSAFKGGKDLDVTPALHDFEFVDVGQQSPLFSFQATNLGTQTRYLTVQSATLAGTDAVHFELDVAAIMLPALVYPGDILALPVRYKPLAMGSHSATLTVSADSDDPIRRMITVTVQGHSQPTLNVSVDDVGFGSVQVGQEATRTTTIRNNSNVPISVTAATFANGMGTMGFYLVTPSQFPISQQVAASGGTATVDLVFRPTGSIMAPQMRQDTLNIAYSYGAGQQAQASGVLLGTATPPPPPPGGPDLHIHQVFTRNNATAGCGYMNNYQNMDLILEGGGGLCDKGGGADSTRNCAFGSLGSGRWVASGGVAPEPYAEEVITHNKDGGDGTFSVKNRYWDDCSSYERQGAAAFMQFACDAVELRCSCWAPSVYPYLYDQQCLPQGGNCGGGECIFSTSCLNAAAAFGGKCAKRSASTAKTVVTIRSASGQVVQQKAFCRAFNTASPSFSADVVGLVREQGFFRLGTTAAGTTELANVNGTCP